MSAPRVSVLATGSQDFEPIDVPNTVGEQLDTPAPEAAAEAEGSLAARVAAKAQRLKQRTKRIPVPPDDVWDGELVLVARPVKVKSSTPFLVLVADATDHLEMLDSHTGQWDVVADGWAGLGRIMGLSDASVSIGQIILAVCSSQEVVNGLGEQILAFIMGRQSLIEQALGE